MKSFPPWGPWWLPALDLSLLPPAPGNIPAILATLAQGTSHTSTAPQCSAQVVPASPCCEDPQRAVPVFTRLVSPRPAWLWLICDFGQVINLPQSEVLICKMRIKNSSYFTRLWRRLTQTSRHASMEKVLSVQAHGRCSRTGPATTSSHEGRWLRLRQPVSSHFSDTPPCTDHSQERRSAISSLRKEVSGGDCNPAMPAGGLTKGAWLQVTSGAATTSGQSNPGNEPMAES